MVQEADGMIELPYFIFGICVGVGLGGLLADWSMKKYPDYWIKWIKEHRRN